MLGKSIRKGIVTLGALALATLGLADRAAAQALPPVGQDEDGWRNSAAIYMFAPVSTQGTSTIAGATVPIDLDLSDVLDLLDFAAAARYEAWNGNLGIIVDANYVGIEATGPFPAPAGSTFRVNVRQKWLGVYGAYKVADGTYGASNQRYTVDLQGGLRWNNLRQQLAVNTPGPLGPPVLGGDEDWFEPVIGLRGMWRLNNRWTGILSAEAGGFGAGGNDLQLAVNAGFDFKPWANTSLVFGYRYFSMDYSTVTGTGPFGYDVEQHGPYIGLKINFN